MSAQDEVAALERIQTRVALTPEGQLATLLDKLLCPVLKKLAVEAEVVRQKVLDLLKLILTRIKSVPSAPLPTKALLNVFTTEGAANALVCNMSLMYLQIGFDRCTPQQQFELAGLVLKGVAARAPHHRIALLQLAMRGLQTAAGGLPHDVAASTEQLRSAFPMLTTPADLNVFMAHALKTLLYLPNYTTRARQDVAPLASVPAPNLLPLLRAQNPAASEVEAARHSFALATAQAEAAARVAEGSVPEEGGDRAPPGLAQADVEALGVPKGHLTAAAVRAQKLALLRLFAAADDIAPRQCVLHLQAACVDSNDDVVREGEALLRKKCALDTAKPEVDLEDAALVAQIFSLVLGSAAPPLAPPNGGGGSGSGPGAIAVQPCSPALQIRLLRMCCKSIAAANTFPQCLQAIVAGLYGRESTLRVKQAVMEFAVWVFRHANDAHLSAMAPLVFQGVMQLLTTLEVSENQQVLLLRGFLYQAIGQLSQRAPQLFKASSETPALLFGALEAEPAGIKAAVQEAINSCAKAYVGVAGETAAEMAALLTRSMQSRHDSVRMCAVNWAVQAYPFDDVFARHICLIAAGDAKNEIRQAGLRGLKLTATSGAAPGDRPSEAAPSFAQVLAAERAHHPRLLVPPAPSASPCLPGPAMLALLRFLDACRLREGAPGAAPEAPDGSAPMAVDSASDAAAAADPELDKCRGRTSEGYLLLLEHALLRESPTDVQLAALRSLVSIATEDREFVATAYAPRSGHVASFLAHLDHEVRWVAARLLGIVAGGLDDAAAGELLTRTVGAFSGAGAAAAKAKYEEQAGSVLAAGFVAAALARRPAQSVRDAVRHAVLALVTQLGGKDATLAAAAVLSLGHVQLAAPLPLEVGAAVELADSKSVSAIGAVDSTQLGVAAAAKRLTGDPRVANAPRLLLQIVRGVGYLAHGSPDGAVSEALVRLLLAQTPTGEQEELHFTVGEALAFAFGGLALSPEEVLWTDFESLAAQHRMLGDVATTTPAVEPRAMASAGAATPGGARAEELIAAAVLEKVLSSNASHRCAACVWLVSLLTYCPGHPRLRAMLLQAQEIFAQLLGDSNDLTQEMASKGMSVVYSLGDDTTKQRLVDSLVGTLQGKATAARAVKLTDDSKLFEQGALGTTPGGGAISTYKELCSLATDLGQPELIYRFMDIANQNALLNSRRGAAFGFASIAKLSMEKLQPHVAMLLPKLYRYQYDPNPRVQEAMGHILTALVPEKARALDEHFDAVLRDLLRELGSGLWRNRQAACLGVADLLAGRSWAQLRPVFGELWGMALRVVDDIKESVRVNGQRLFRVLKQLTVRFADKDRTAAADSQAALDVVLPVLVEKGIQSSVGYVKAESIDTISSIVDVAAPAQFAGQLPSVVNALLESLSSLESAQLNQLQMHAERIGIDGAQLEGARVSASGHTPMWSALDRCGRLVTEDSIAELLPVLTHLIRRGVGLNTRVGAARFVVNVNARLGGAMQRPAGELLKALLAATQAERSVVVRRAFAGAIGALAKTASAKRVEWLITGALQLYTTPGDVDSRMAAALVMQQVTRQAADRAAGLSDAILPVAFRGRWDTDKEIADLWSEVWTECSTSESAALLLHGGAIVEALSTELQRDEWSQRRSAALAIAGMARSSADAMAPYARGLVQLLLSQLPGRVWDGKAALLDAIAALVASCPAVFTAAGEGEVSDAAVVVALVESSARGGADFRAAAATALEQTLAALKGRNHFARVAPVLELAAAQAAAGAEVSGQRGDGEGEGPGGALDLKACLAVLGAACAHSVPATAAAYLPQLAVALKGGLHPQQTWAVRTQALQTVAAVSLALSGLPADALEAPPGATPEADAARGGGAYSRVADGSALEQCESLVTHVIQAGDDKLSQVRGASVEALRAIILATDGGGQLSAAIQEVLLDHLRTVQASDKSPAVKSQAAVAVAALRVPGDA